jgi:hypothetical protein
MNFRWKKLIKEGKGCIIGVKQKKRSPIALIPLIIGGCYYIKWSFKVVYRDCIRYFNAKCCYKSEKPTDNKRI